MRQASRTRSTSLASLLAQSGHSLADMLPRCRPPKPPFVASAKTAGHQTPEVRTKLASGRKALLQGSDLERRCPFPRKAMRYALFAPQAGERRSKHVLAKWDDLIVVIEHEALQKLFATGLCELSHAREISCRNRR